MTDKTESYKINLTQSSTFIFEASNKYNKDLRTSQVITLTKTIPKLKLHMKSKPSTRAQLRANSSRNKTFIPNL